MAWYVWVAIIVPALFVAFVMWCCAAINSHRTEEEAQAELEQDLEGFYENYTIPEHKGKIAVMHKPKCLDDIAEQTERANAERPWYK